MRNKLRFSFSALIVIAIALSFIVGCLDANGKNAELDKTYVENLDRHIAKVNTNFQNPPAKATLIKDELLEKVSDKSRFNTTFAVLKTDENISAKHIMSDLLCDRSDLRLIALTKISNMGTQAYDILIEAYKSADTETKLAYCLNSISHVLLSTDLDDFHRHEIMKMIRETVDNNSGKLQKTAIQLLAKVADDHDYMTLANHLNIDDEITRLLIYRKLRNTKTYDVLAIVAKHLNDDELAVRNYAVNILRQVTDQYFGYNPGGELISRQIQAFRWQSYIQNNNKFNNSVSR